MAKIITVPTISDERGSLSVLDNHLNFSIQRVFYIYNVSSKRGGHRHIENQMCLIVLNGSVDIYVQSPNEDQVFTISSPDQALLLEPEDWHTMENFTLGSTLLVLNSHAWSKEDYVYEPYRKEIN